MRTLVGLLLAVSVACGGDPAAAPSTPSPPPTQGPGGWSLVFADEFDTAGAVDSAKWGYELGYIRNNERQVPTRRAPKTYGLKAEIW